MEFNISTDIDLSQVHEEIKMRKSLILRALEGRVKNDCPVDTGYMKSTIGIKDTDEDSAVYVDADYAPYTEYKQGTTCTGWFSRAIESAASEVSKLWH